MYGGRVLTRGRVSCTCSSYWLCLGAGAKKRKLILPTGNNPRTHAFFEIGFGQRDDVAEILAGNKGVAVLNVRKDRADIDRCIVAHCTNL
jgi:hypothetical protein